MAANPNPSIQDQAQTARNTWQDSTLQANAAAFKAATSDADKWALTPSEQLVQNPQAFGFADKAAAQQWINTTSYSAAGAGTAGSKVAQWNGQGMTPAQIAAYNQANPNSKIGTPAPGGGIVNAGTGTFTPGASPTPNGTVVSDPAGPATTAQPAAGAPPAGNAPAGTGTVVTTDPNNTSTAPVAGATPDGAAGTVPGVGTGTGIGATGLVNTGLDMPTAPDTPTILPESGAVTNDQTVQGQLAQMLSTGNPLLDAAKDRAMQTANQRGLQNSSMAAQAGEEAMVNTAEPIASEDAAAFRQQALTNQSITNQFLSAQQGANINLQAAYEAFKQNNYAFDQNASLQTYINDSSHTSQEKIAAMQSASNQATLDERLQEAGMTINANTAAATAAFDRTTATNLINLKNTNFQNYTNSVNAISTSSLDPTAKANAINNQAVIYAGMAFPDGFKFVTAPTPDPTTAPPPPPPGS